MRAIDVRRRRDTCPSVNVDSLMTIINYVEIAVVNTVRSNGTMFISRRNYPENAMLTPLKSIEGMMESFMTHVERWAARAKVRTGRLLVIRPSSRTHSCSTTVILRSVSFLSKPLLYDLRSPTTTFPTNLLTRTYLQVWKSTRSQKVPQDSAHDQPKRRNRRVLLWVVWPLVGRAQDCCRGPWQTCYFPWSDLFRRQFSALLYPERAL